MYYYDKKGNKIQGSTKQGFNKPVSTKQANDVENDEGEGGSKHPTWVLIMLSLICISIIVYLIWYFFLKK
jgi:hypothetical protein